MSVLYLRETRAWAWTGGWWSCSGSLTHSSLTPRSLFCMTSLWRTGWSASFQTEPSFMHWGGKLAGRFNFIVTEPNVGQETGSLGWCWERGLIFHKQCVLSKTVVSLLNQGHECDPLACWLLKQGFARLQHRSMSKFLISDQDLTCQSDTGPEWEVIG